MLNTLCVSPQVFLLFFLILQADMHLKLPIFSEQMIITKFSLQPYYENQQFTCKKLKLGDGKRSVFSFFAGSTNAFPSSFGKREMICKSFSGKLLKKRTKLKRKF